MYIIRYVWVLFPRYFAILSSSKGAFYLYKIYTKTLQASFFNTSKRFFDFM